MSIYNLDRLGYYECRRCLNSSDDPNWITWIPFLNEEDYYPPAVDESRGIYCRECWQQMPLDEKLAGYAHFLEDGHDFFSWSFIADFIWKDHIRAG